MHYVSAAVFALVALGLRIVLEPYLNLQVPFLTFWGGRRVDMVWRSRTGVGRYRIIIILRRVLLFSSLLACHLEP